MVADLSPELVRSALDASPDAMLLVDAGGRIVFANQQVVVLFGYRGEEIRGQRVELLIPERLRAGHDARRAQFAVENRRRPMGAGLDLYARRKDGTEFPVEISLSPIHDRNETLTVATIRDVTERKRAQQELVRAREAADRANQAKSRFLATASHDLRQPLQSLSLLNGTLRRLVDHPDALEALAYQDRSIAAMSKLLNTLLDISKLESGAVQPERADFNVTPLFEELRHEFGELARAKGLKFQAVAIAELIHSDRALVGQILRNLLSNAIKYTPSGSVRLSCVGDEQGIRIEIADTGIGIPAQQIDFIYDEFFQVGVPANSSRNGYGLGLSIVQRAVKLLGLRIEVHSEVGQGTVFALHLPAGRNLAGALRAPATPAAASHQGSSPQVLLVEDDPAVRDATRMLLKVSGYRVLTAANLAEAVEHACRTPTLDLLVTDYHLANEATGTEVITALRRNLGRVIPAVLITGDTSAAVQALRGDRHLRLARKPIHAEELLALLKALLEEQLAPSL